MPTAQQSIAQPSDDSSSVPLQDSPRLVGESLPAVLQVPDMLRAFRVKSSTFYKRLKLGQYDRFEIRPRVGRRTWDGTLVQRELRAREAKTFFGRKLSA